jgi:hypothetical protein
METSPEALSILSVGCYACLGNSGSRGVFLANPAAPPVDRRLGWEPEPSGSPLCTTARL